MIYTDNTLNIYADNEDGTVTKWRYNEGEWVSLGNYEHKPKPKEKTDGKTKV